ncbi:MAG: hypothetical protein LIR50_05410 [Bacillota bacterium]|nr:hypothetical protein [Bacillota bacterium]
MKNKYNLDIPNELILRYIDLVINKIYKLLPLYEGMSKSTKQIIIPVDIAYKNYINELELLILEVSGDYYIYKNNEIFLKLLALLEGMQDIKINEHRIVRTSVFKCISLCDSLKDGIREDDL